MYEQACDRSSDWPCPLNMPAGAHVYTCTWMYSATKQESKTFQNHYFGLKIAQLCLLVTKMITITVFMIEFLLNRDSGALPTEYDNLFQPYHPLPYV